MLQKMTRTNEKGFTLIELMIVIAIIGILAAIAIPNFISYRNKAYCSGTESDANGVAAAIADYFAIPSHIEVPAVSDLNGGAGPTVTYPNTVSGVTIGGSDPNTTMTITVVDASSRCPTDYKNAASSSKNTKAYWTSSAFVKLISF